MATTDTPDWVERVLDEADRLADRQANAQRARQAAARIAAVQKRIEQRSDELAVGLCMLVDFGSVVFALAFVNA